VGKPEKYTQQKERGKRRGNAVDVLLRKPVSSKTWGAGGARWGKKRITGDQNQDLASKRHRRKNEDRDEDYNLPERRSHQPISDEKPGSSKTEKKKRGGDVSTPTRKTDQGNGPTKVIH